MNKYLSGSFAVLMTPFAGDAADEATFAKQVNRLKDSRVSGVVTSGSTGEFVQLSLAEQMNLTEIAAKEKGDKKLVVGACTGNAADTLKICRHAATVNAAAALVCPPYYFRYTAAEIEKFYLTVAESSPVPVMLYNIPFFTQELELCVIYRLFEHDNVVGIKDSSANMKRLQHLVAAADSTPVSVLTGTDDILLPALAGGVSGSMTALACIMPDAVADIYAAVESGDIAAARKLQLAILPTLAKADAETFPKGYKRLMEEVSGMKFGDKEDKI